MDKKNRNRVKLSGDVATCLEWLLYGLVWLYALAIVWDAISRQGNIGYDATICIAFAFALRHRILIRAIRLDALIREAEDEARCNPVAQPSAPAPLSVACPKCHISIPIPADYKHSNAKCPHCTHVFKVHG